MPAPQPAWPKTLLSPCTGHFSGSQGQPPSALLYHSAPPEGRLFPQIPSGMAGSEGIHDTSQDLTEGLGTWRGPQHSVLKSDVSCLCLPWGLSLHLHQAVTWPHQREYHEHVSLSSSPGSNCSRPRQLLLPFCGQDLPPHPKATPSEDDRLGKIRDCLRNLISFNRGWCFPQIPINLETMKVQN